GSPIGRRTGGASQSKRRTICINTSGQVQQRRPGWIKERRIKVRALRVALKKWRVIAPAHSVVEGQPAVKFPLVLRIKLKEVDFVISEGTTALLRVTSEVPEQRVGIGIAGASERGRKGCRGAEAQGAGPVSARCLTIQ